MESPLTPAVQPQISVLVPTHGRPDRIQALMARLADQTATANSFEVIIVDDGGEPPVALDVRHQPFSCTVLQQRNAGPAAARNAGLALVAAPLVLILNDDAVPSIDLIERHLAAHRELDPSQADKTAVLGTFHFTDAARESAFVRVLDETDRLFTFSGLKHGQRHDWTYFWTCNLSLPVAALFAVGGFDAENFDRAICEDVELGLRLEQQGLHVLFDERCVAHHDHMLTPNAYAERAEQLGIYQRRLQEKHGAADAKQPGHVAAQKKEVLSGFGERLRAADQYFDELSARNEELSGRTVPGGFVQETDAALTEWSNVYREAGIYRQMTGVDLVSLTRNGAANGTSVAAVIVSFNALENTKRCISALRAAADPRYPLELIIVDNGSTDGSAEWIREQADIQSIFNPENFGAPRARNQGLALVREGTDWIAFFDNDVFVPNGWMERALFHGAADPEVGSIALCANRASKSQILAYDGGSDQSSIDAFAAGHAQQNLRSGDDCTLFTSLAVLVRADVMERIGGFDESFSPWGFEDDDIALRIRLAGWRNRVAKDTFVFHAAYDGPAKEQRHSAWLHQNWEAFLTKWSPGALGSELFDYSRVTLPQLGQATEAQLYSALPHAGTAPPTWLGKESKESAPVVDEIKAKGCRVVEPSNVAAPSSNREGRANVLVMGCGRSGTSMVTGMLSDAGWYVGENPYPARTANAKGFFETAEVNGINEYLLVPAVSHEAPKRRMQHWLSHAPEALDLEVPDGIRARMDQLGQKGPFAYKDPRFCYTLDAWRPSVPDAKFVCIFREPAATAASIMKEVGGEEYLQGCGIDFAGALNVWNAMYRRILDDHSQTGQWLFLHFDELFTRQGVEKLEAFVGAPVAADFPEARLKSSRSEEPIPAEIADTFAELCERAGTKNVPTPKAIPRPEPVLEVHEPELTVLICTYQRKETLLRCLASFENQTAAGRYEIVVVNDGATDGTKEALDAWEPSAPLRIVHQENGGLAAARNAGLAVSRGKYVLFVNDDTIAAPENVEEHLLAHAKHGPGRAILGSFEQPREALDNALMRVLEETTMVFCYAALDPTVLHDWNRFWTCNVSVSLDDVRRVGGFDESFRHYGCEDTDLAYRLHTECGTRVVYVPTARAEHEHILTFDDLRKRARTVSAAYVRFFHKHPETLSHPFWSDRSTTPLAAREDMLVRTLPDRSRAETLAKELSSIDIGTIERAGPEGAQIAMTIKETLKAYLRELNHLWWAEGQLEATRAGVGKDAIARARAAAQKATAELIGH